ncbi:VOC family protein [Saccharothrix hoggarensis]|uniref:VOC family protein n=1 Tax=Saccharothrix hoggarensis TaxID=913853 RepID=A0ABW3QPJ1_9PSEU
MILGIDHVGLATGDAEGVGVLLAALGLSKVEAGVAEPYGVSCDFWQFGPDPRLPAVEVVAPVAEGSSIDGRLARNGPGLYHIAFEVDDLEAELTRLRGNGFTPVDAEPCQGARPGMTVAFLYLRKPAGVLVELVHYRTRRRAPAP